MARPKKLRFIKFNPRITFYKPQGVPLSILKITIISKDELEALRLKYYLQLEQKECAKRMKISQSTFQRTLSAANKKIAQALIEGRAIRITEN